MTFLLLDRLILLEIHLLYQLSFFRIKKQVRVHGITVLYILRRILDKLFLYFILQVIYLELPCRLWLFQRWCGDGLYQDSLILNIVVSFLRSIGFCHCWQHKLKSWSLFLYFCSIGLFLYFLLLWFFFNFAR